MGEIEKLKLVEMWICARGRRSLLARIGRALRLLTQAQVADDHAQLVALRNEIGALAAEIKRLR